MEQGKKIARSFALPGEDIPALALITMIFPLQHTGQ